MTRLFDLRYAVCVFAAALFVSGCATTQGDTGSSRSAEKPVFKNILVIGVAENYEGRSTFERTLANDLTAAGVTATALYVAAGGNKPITREAVKALVDSEGYDGVLISRVIDRDEETSVTSGSSATKATHKDGGPINLFRYDYEELNEPATVNFSLGVVMYTELYGTDQEERVWDFQASIPPQDYRELLINEASERIVRRLERDKMLARAR